jgi:RNA polymerase sigma-70 factor (ECF subfamily)
VHRSTPPDAGVVLRRIYGYSFERDRLMDTSASLLDSLRDASDEGAWSRLVDLYSPLIRGWLTRRGAAVDDVEDVAQEVLAVVVRRFPEFRRQPQIGAFRAWLRAITVNCLRDHWRRNNKQPTAVGGTDFGVMVQQLEDPHSVLSKLWDREHDEHVTQYLLKQIRPDFAEKTWKAFQRFALDGLSADEVGKELQMTANAVFIAKSRVMAALRDRGRGLID